MSQQFINRRFELDYLNNKHNSKKPEFIVIYGRRRIGKTQLILEFIKDKKAIYFLCTKEGDRENIKNFSVQVSRLINDNSFSRTTYGSWFDLFELMFKNINVLNLLKKQKLIIVFDEFPFLIHSNRAITSVFQKIWELILKKHNVMLILLGSQVSVMESEILSVKSPLYGRRTGQLMIDELDFPYLRGFFPKYNIDSLAKVWFVLGGIPEYLLKFEPDESFFHNVKTKILTKGTYLLREANVLLNEELKETKNYKLILRAIANGKTKLYEICNDTGLDKSMVSKYLYVLENLRIVKKIKPITASLNFKRHVHIIEDSYFNFWFRYVYPNMIDIEALRTEEVFSTIRNTFLSYAGKMFEKLIIHLLIKKIIENNFTRIGRWWHKDKEIDVVALNEEKKEILFGECKYKENVNPEPIIKELKKKAKYVNWFNDERKEKYVIFAKSFKKKPKLKDVLLYDLKDIEKMLRK